VGARSTRESCGVNPTVTTSAFAAKRRAIVVRRIHHVGIVVRSLDDAYRFYRVTLGLPLLHEAVVADQGVRAALLGAGESEIELLEPLDAGNGVGRFLERHGEGLHHICFDTPDVDAAVRDLAARDVELIDRAPRTGLAGRIAFLHPRACAGVLVELATPLSDAPAVHTTPIELKRLVIGARDPGATAARFQALFALPQVAINGGPRVMLGVGKCTLLVVPAEEVGGTEGMVALSLVAEDFARLTEACDHAQVKILRGTGEVTIDPASSHGVHVHISRFRFP
jgi:methylmalonyl-CoA/ethylmalonyl-CoA epimerase